MQHFGKRKFGGGGGGINGAGGGHSGISNNSNGGTLASPTDYFMSPKNQRLRPCRDIVYTEDSVPVRKLYFCVPTADVSQ